MQQYLDLLKRIRTEGRLRPSRAKLADGTQPDTQGLFGVQTRYDLAGGFPLVTTKKLGTKGFVTELLWFLRGDSNIAFLREHKCTIWDEWADEHGELGPVYGAQWRRWQGENGETFDQIAELERGLREQPFSRRHILTAWNVAVIPQMKLPPCHVLSQFYVDTDGTLSCQLYQRSADMFLGVPWNIACYSLLTCMLAQVTGLKPGTFVHTIGDAHIYANHFAQVDEQITRTPLPLPTLWLDPSVTSSVLDFRHEHIRIEGYRHHAPLVGEVAV
jgi:thymidylate synthase